MSEAPPKRATALRAQIAQHHAELLRLKGTLDLAFGLGQRPSDKPEDRVLFPLGVSCRDLFEEILCAVDEGFGRMALRSVRTLYECIAFCRHIHLHPEKAEAFLQMFHTQWAKVLQNMPEPEIGMPEVHSRLTSTVPKYAAGKPISMQDLKWTSDSTYQMAKDAGSLRDLHPLAFDYASAYIHPSSVFLLSHMSQAAPDSDVIRVSMDPEDTESTIALKAAHDLILNAVDLRLKYVPLAALQQQFDDCKRDFLKIWNYEPHI
jgi:hypothetical protein